MAHKWQPIADLDESDINQPVHEELRHLAEIWREQQTGLDEKQLHIFNEKLKREWAIETGQIEGVYDINHGTTETLIEHGISEQVLTGAVQDSAKTLAMLQDHEHVVDGLFDFVKGGRALSTSYIKEMHAALTKNQETTVGVDAHGKKRNIPLRHGAFKTMPNDPKTPFGEVHEYCPPEHTDSEMDKLIAEYLGHNERDVPPLAAAAWLHHRFTQIHPFQDGNGRVARCLASIIFIKAGWFPLVINRKIRDNYLDALQTADGGDLSALINLFADVQRKCFVNAQDIAESVQSEFDINAFIKSAATEFKQARHVPEEYMPAIDIAEKLAAFTKNHLQNISTRIQAEFDMLHPVLLSYANNDLSDRLMWQSEAHQFLSYQPNTDVYAASEILSLPSKLPSYIHIVVLFHGVSAEYQGTNACFAIAYDASKIIPLSKEAFQFNHKDSLEEVKKRFEPWLLKSLSAGLRMWKENL